MLILQPHQKPVSLSDASDSDSSQSWLTENVAQITENVAQITENVAQITEKVARDWIWSH